MKKQQEVMGLYSQYGVSPMGGCLPMLLQFPILMALFMFVPSAIELRQQSFLWADDLSTYDAFITFPFILFLGNTPHFVLLADDCYQHPESEVHNATADTDCSSRKWLR